LLPCGSYILYSIRIVFFFLRILTWRPLRYCARRLSRWLCKPCARPRPAVNGSNSSSCRCSSKRAGRSTLPGPRCPSSWESPAISRRRRSARFRRRWTRNRTTRNSATTTNRTSATCSLPPRCRSDRSRLHRYRNEITIMILLYS